MQPIDNREPGRIVPTQDLIDSRDVIERIEQLAGRQFDHNDLTQDELKELEQLKALQSQAESSPDWIHGETLIRRSYFEQYIADLIDDCYDLPKQLGSGEWPWRHVQIDIEAAAEEAEQDYTEVTFGGVEYLIRA